MLAGLILVGLVILVAIFAPLLTPYDPIAQNLDDAFQPPLSPGHALGTDNFGRDIWSRIVYSTRLDLQIGLISVLFPFIFGSLIGITTGYLGGRFDTAVMRVVDVLMAFPFLVLVVAIMSILGPGHEQPVHRGRGLVGWIAYARIMRGGDAGHAQPGVRPGGTHHRLRDAAHHAAPPAAERDRAGRGLRLHGHGAGDL